MERTCIKCNLTKPMEEFGLHKASKGGRLTKCRSCVNEHERLKLKDPVVLEKTRAYARMRYHLKQKKEETFPIDENFRAVFMTKEERQQKKKISHDSYYGAFPEKWHAKNRCQRLKTKVHGNQFHHWSYNPAHYRDVIELTKMDHMKLHRFIIYDQERFMYRRYDTNELLDTREAHEAFSQYVLTNLQ